MSTDPFQEFPVSGQLFLFHVWKNEHFDGLLKNVLILIELMDSQECNMGLACAQKINFHVNLFEKYICVDWKVERFPIENRYRACIAHNVTLLLLPFGRTHRSVITMIVKQTAVE